MKAIFKGNQSPHGYRVWRSGCCGAGAVLIESSFSSVALSNLRDERPHMRESFGSDCHILDSTRLG